MFDIPQDGIIEKVDNALLYTYICLMSPFIIAGYVLSISFHAMEHGIDKTCEIIRKREHENNVKSNWRYRFVHTTVKISQLRIWQDVILETNQFDRAILQIAEAEDIPYECWSPLCEESDEKDFFRKQKEYYGTENYEKDKCVSKAFKYFLNKYDVFTGKSMEFHIEDLLERNKLKCIDFYCK